MKIVISIISAFCIAAVCVIGFDNYLLASMPDISTAVLEGTDSEKLKGVYLLDKAANDKEEIILFGSSELLTTMIPTHPANFFRDIRDFDINLFGRGSAQSIVHALNVGSVAEDLQGSKFLLITSPQSYVEGGIKPDLFFANFSSQQYLHLILNNDISDDIKQRISARIVSLFAQYDELEGHLKGYDFIRAFSKSVADDNKIIKSLLYPYARMQKSILDIKDKVVVKKYLSEMEPGSPAEGFSYSDIDWNDEEKLAIEDGIEASNNNEFYILNDYYTTNIGSRLMRNKDKEADLSYDESVEYIDLKILLDLCRELGLEPLFISPPNLGGWSDFTGFTKERRDNYYKNINDIVNDYENVTFLDLSYGEYIPYFLCDPLHLGWKGWLEVDKAIVEYYK